MKQLETPMAFIIFNRPDTTQKVFNEIKKVKPKKLFIISDGARNDKEKIIVERARDIINQVDWDCEIMKNYSNSNLGCRLRVSSGIDWFFKNVEQGIILEDDCLPSVSFFYFCEDLLNKYSSKEEVMMISGDNFYINNDKNNYDYFFSQKNFNIWGWATWKRAWEKYDVDMSDWETSGVKKFFPENSNNSITEKNIINFFERTFRGQIDTWDYQWLYACLKNDGSSIIPKKNLITNIGFDKRATHTNNPSHILANLKRKEMCFPLKHPPTIINSDNNITLIKKNEILKNLFRKNMNLIKKIWTKSPRDIFTKIIKIFRIDTNKIVEQNLAIKNGFIKGAVLTVSNKMNKTEESMIDGKYENDIIEKLISNTSSLKNKTIWDIGAHVGYHSLVFSRLVGDGGIIISVEPNPDNLESLKKNIKNNPESKNIKILNEAISDRVGNINMNICKEKNHISSSGGYLSDTVPPLSHESYVDFKNITVPSSTIDSLVYDKKFHSPDIIKIDVEGAELKVLIGAKEVIKNIKPTFIIEIHSIPMMYHLHKLFNEINYKTEMIDEESNFITKNIIATPIE